MVKVGIVKANHCQGGRKEKEKVSRGVQSEEPLKMLRCRVGGGGGK